MDHDNSADFAFETWERLARHDPDQFEAKRLEAIERLISTAPESKQQRLRGLQWQVDQTRARAESPLAACVRVSALMWETVAGENGLLENLASLTRTPHAKPRTPQTAAEVLVFKRPEETEED